jgi:hypothetical protein
VSTARDRRVTVPPVHLGRDRYLGPLFKLIEAYQPKKPLRIEYKIAMPDRTPAENRYLWAVPYQLLSDASGYEKSEIHEWNCGEQWGWKNKRVPIKPSNPTGFESVPIRTTTENADGEPELCSEEEFLQMWARAQRLAAVKFDIIVPDPDKNWKQGK